MRRLGVLAAGLLGLCALPAIFPAGSARAAEKEPVTATLTMSRGHELLTVVIRNGGPTYACIDANYGAPARIFALGRDNRTIRSSNTTEGAAKACLPLAPRKSIHVVYDLRPLYPMGLPGYSRICYGAMWKMGGVQSLAPQTRFSRCLTLPEQGLGRR